MNVKEDNLTRMLNKVVPDKYEEESEECGLPDLKDSVNECHARPAEKPVFAIHFIKPDGVVTSFQLMHLDSGSIFDGGSIRLRFLGMKPAEVEIRGRGLYRLYDLIHGHRMRWVRESSRDMGQDARCVVTSIQITEIEEPTAEPF